MIINFMNIQVFQLTYLKWGLNFKLKIGYLMLYIKRKDVEILLINTKYSKKNIPIRFMILCMMQYWLFSCRVSFYIEGFFNGFTGWNLLNSNGNGIFTSLSWKDWYFHFLMVKWWPCTSVTHFPLGSGNIIPSKEVKIPYLYRFNQLWL